MRPPGAPTPCHRCPKIPKGQPPRPEHAAELTDQNWRALKFHQSCKAVGQWPDDAIVRRNARVIELALDEIRDRWAATGADLLRQLGTLLVMKR
jgi:hypothetical protein